MIANLAISFLMMSSLLFDVNLKNVDESYLNNSVVIIIDGIYCKDCFTSLIDIRHIWKENYKTIVLVKIIKGKENARRYRSTLRNYKIDSLLFFEQETYSKFPLYKFDKYEFSKSPSVLIFKDNAIEQVNYDDMFSSRIDTNAIKKVMLKKLKK